MLGMADFKTTYNNSIKHFKLFNHPWGRPLAYLCGRWMIFGLEDDVHILFHKLQRPIRRYRAAGIAAGWVSIYQKSLHLACLPKHLNNEQQVRCQQATWLISTSFYGFIRRVNLCATVFFVSGRRREGSVPLVPELTGPPEQQGGCAEGSVAMVTSNTHLT